LKLTVVFVCFLKGSYSGRWRY